MERERERQRRGKSFLIMKRTERHIVRSSHTHTYIDTICYHRAHFRSHEAANAAAPFPPLHSTEPNGVSVVHVAELYHCVWYWPVDVDRPFFSDFQRTIFKSIKQENIIVICCITGEFSHPIRTTSRHLSITTFTWVPKDGTKATEAPTYEHGCSRARARARKHRAPILRLRCVRATVLMWKFFASS